LGEWRGEVVVDTYVILAMAYGELGVNAERAMLGIKRGEISGIIPVTVVYKLVLHWLRSKLPAFKNIEEIKTFTSMYFKVADSKLSDYVESAKIKVEGDRMLKSNPELKERTLSLVDSIILWTAIKHLAPIVTGDRDIAWVAREKGVEVIW
jgi:predicted nucleic acid-binding protein